MTTANPKFYAKQALKLTLAAVGALLFLSPSVKAADITPSSSNVREQSVSNHLQNSSPVLVARNYGCPERSGGSQFVFAETRNFFVYICGGDLPNTYVGVSKNRNTGGIILPLRSYNNSQFTAVNGNVRYTLTRNQLTVTQNGRVIVKERATWRF